MSLSTAAAFKRTKPLGLRTALKKRNRSEEGVLRMAQARKYPRVLFMHLPKCGGSSLHSSLTQIYPKPLVLPERHNGLNGIGPETLQNVRVLSGHFDFQSTAPIRDGFNLVSIMRDPRARLQSMYNFLAAHRLNFESSPTFRLHELAHEHSIDAFFTSDEVRAHPAINNGLVRSLSDMPLPFYRWEDTASVPGDDDLQQRLTEATQNLQAFYFIGELSQMSETLAAFKTHLGLKGITEKREQSLTTIMQQREDMRQIEPQKLAPGHASVLDDLVAYDERLFAAAAQLFSWHRPA